MKIIITEDEIKKLIVNYVNDLFGFTKVNSENVHFPEYWENNKAEVEIEEVDNTQ